MRFFVLAAFFASVLFLPWYCSVTLAIALVAFFRAYTSVVIGGVLLDSMFGTPIGALGGFSFVYTTLFILLSVMAYILRRTMME